MWFFALILLLPSLARAEAMLVRTDDGYRRAAVERGVGVLTLEEISRVEGGMATKSSARVTMLTEEGEALWVKTFGGAADDKLAQAVRTDGGWICAGESASTDLGAWHEGRYEAYAPKSDGWAMRVDDQGALVWTRLYGGSDWDRFYGACETEDGGALLVGETTSRDGDVSGWHDSGEMLARADGWAVRIDAEGEILWQRALGGSGEDALHGVVRTEAGFLCVGVTGAEETDGWVLLLSEAGEMLYEATHGGAGDDALLAIAKGEGGYMAVGSTDDADTDAWALLLDARGTLLQEAFFGLSNDEQLIAVAWQNEQWLALGRTYYPAEIGDWIAAYGDDGWEVIRGAM